MRRLCACLVVLVGCDDIVSGGSDSVFAVGDPNPMVGFAPAAPYVTSLAAPDAATPRFPNVVGANDCASAFDYERIFGACPATLPSIESCTVEGLECLYATAADAVAADAGTSACYEIVRCSLGLWSPLGERCSGPLQFNPRLPAAPRPIPQGPSLPAEPSTSPSIELPPAPSLSNSIELPPVPSMSMAPMSSSPASSVLMPVAATGGGGADGGPPDAGAYDAGTADASTPQSDGSATDASAIDAIRDAGSALDSSEPGSSEPSIIPLPVMSTQGSEASDAGEIYGMDAAVTDCPQLSPVPGSECLISQTCGYGSCPDQTAAFLLECVCGHWFERAAVCNVAAGR
jgi:hypothetical protein